MQYSLHFRVCAWMLALALVEGMAGCVVLPVEETAPQPALQAPAPGSVSAGTEDSIPQPRAVLNLARPTPASKPPATPKNQTKAAKAANDDKTVVVPVTPAEPLAKPVDAPVANKPKPASALSAQIVREFPWLQRCASHVEAGGAIQCDADALLAQPSARVQVFVRDPRLVRSEGGRIQLREGLPRLYRLFVFP